jgi:hypothetical protein
MQTVAMGELDYYEKERGVYQQGRERWIDSGDRGELRR